METSGVSSIIIFVESAFSKSHDFKHLDCPNGFETAITIKSNDVQNHQDLLNFADVSIFLQKHSIFWQI